MAQHPQFTHRGDRRVANDDNGPDRRHLDLAVGIIETYARCLRTHSAVCNEGELLSGLPRLEGIEGPANVFASGGWVDSLWNAVVSERGDDRIVSSLSRALDAIEQEDVQDGANQLRLAIAMKLLDRRSSAATPVTADQSERKQREVRALQKWRLKRVIEYVDGRLSERITLSDMAAVAGLSRMHFASQFRVATGVRPHEFVLRRRVRRAVELLRDSTISIVEIALTVGFQTQAHLTTVFKRFVGCTPGRWRAMRKRPDFQGFGGNPRSEFVATAVD